MKRTLMIALPLLVVTIGALGAVAMIKARPEPETIDPEPPVPLVRVLPVERQDLSYTVLSQGTVKPRTDSILVTEVAGRIVEVAPSFEGGGFFDKGELLVRIDDNDYRQAVIQAGAQVAQAELRVAREQAEAEVAVEEWQDLGGGEVSPLTLREPQVADANAGLESARAMLERAERDLQRTQIRAPYAGRLREKFVDVGQFVNRGTQLADVYAVDYAEIRLPIPDADLAFIELPLDYRDLKRAGGGPAVTLRAHFAGRINEWQGRLVRTEGEIDPRSRMVFTVAQVKDPYGLRTRGADGPPLAAGLFVEAEIQGHTVEDVFVLPRSVMRGKDQVLIVDDDERLRFRTVEVLRTTPESVVVGSGLTPGERVCMSAIAAVTDGMKVRPLLEDTSDDPVSVAVEREG
jgi:RND family efflux transporter MFP subunit